MLLAFLVQCLVRPSAWLEGFYLRWTRLPPSSPALGLSLDLTRTKSELLLENALLRQQLVIVKLRNRTSLVETVSRSCSSPAGSQLGSSPC